MSWGSTSRGRAKWISQSVNQNDIEDSNYTVENAPGGTWFAKRVTGAVRQNTELFVHCRYR